MLLAILISLTSSISHASEQIKNPVSDKLQQDNKLLILGDSLSAGYQMRVEDSWPTLLATKLKVAQNINVVNASISGDTSGNGLARLPQLLEHHNPKWLLIELGANDGLRGFAPSEIKTNLKQMIEIAKEHNVQPILMQIKMPPNYGKRYTQAFSDVYLQVSQERAVPVIPFFLEEVILKQEWMKQDGLHPNEKAQPWISDYIYQQLEMIYTE